MSIPPSDDLTSPEVQTEVVDEPPLIVERVAGRPRQIGRRQPSPNSPDVGPHQALSAAVAYVVAAAIGLVVALVVVGPELVFGRRSDVLSMRGDAAIGLAGFRYFVDDAWHFPLLKTTGLAAPDGIAIIYTDSIPLMALLAKATRFLGIAPERWWGGWFGAVFVAQSLATVFTLRAWRIESKTALWAASVSLCLFPALLLRIFHPALMLQAPLLVSLGLLGWFRRPKGRGWSGGLLTTLTVVLPVLALLIHPYHAVGTLVVVATGLVDALRRGDRSIGYVVKVLGAIAASLALTLVSFGYVGGIGEYASGYGETTFIPYNFFWPQYSQIWPGDDQILLTEGSFEGFVFLGFGLLLVSVLGAASAWSARRRFAQRNAAIVTGFSLLVLYCITPRVYLNPDDPLDFGAFAMRFVDTPERVMVLTAGFSAASAAIGLGWIIWRRSWSWQTLGEPIVVGLAAVELAALPVLIKPEILYDLVGTFRASGRLIWVVAYALCVGSIVTIHRRFGPRAIAAVLLVAVGLQFYDQRQLRSFAHDLYAQDAQRAEQLEAMANTASSHNLVRLSPAYTCVPFGPQLDEYVDVVVAASMSATPIDSTYAARQQTSSCQDTVQYVDDGSLYVLVGLDPADVSPVGFAPDRCRRWSENVQACSSELEEIDSSTRSFFEDQETARE